MKLESVSEKEAELLKRQTIRHWQRMIDWAAKQDPTEQTDQKKMYKSIGERPSESYCALCKFVGRAREEDDHMHIRCGNCTVGDHGAHDGCGNTPFVFAFCSWNWGQFVDNAQRELEFLKEHNYTKMLRYVPERLVTVGSQFGRDSTYYGDRADWYVVAAHTRDSENLEESNFVASAKACGIRDITSELYPYGFAIERYNHWAVGWIEALLVAPTYEAGQRIAEDLKKQLDEYPVLDEEDYTNREFEDELEEEEYTNREFEDELEEEERESLPYTECGEARYTENEMGSYFFAVLARDVPKHIGNVDLENACTKVLTEEFLDDYADFMRTVLDDEIRGIAKDTIVRFCKARPEGQLELQV